MSAKHSNSYIPFIANGLSQITKFNEVSQDQSNQQIQFKQLFFNNDNNSDPIKIKKPQSQIIGNKPTQINQQFPQLPKNQLTNRLSSFVNSIKEINLYMREKYNLSEIYNYQQRLHKQLSQQIQYRKKLEIYTISQIQKSQSIDTAKQSQILQKLEQKLVKIEQKVCGLLSISKNQYFQQRKYKNQSRQNRNQQRKLQNQQKRYKHQQNYLYKNSFKIKKDGVFTEDISVKKITQRQSKEWDNNMRTNRKQEELRQKQDNVMRQIKRIFTNNSQQKGINNKLGIFSKDEIPFDRRLINILRSECKNTSTNSNMKLKKFIQQQSLKKAQQKVKDYMQSKTILYKMISKLQDQNQNNNQEQSKQKYNIQQNNSDQYDQLQNIQIDRQYNKYRIETKNKYNNNKKKTLLKKYIKPNIINTKILNNYNSTGLNIDNIRQIDIIDSSDNKKRIIYNEYKYLNRIKNDQISQQNKRYIEQNSGYNCKNNKRYIQQKGYNIQNNSNNNRKKGGNIQIEIKKEQQNGQTYFSNKIQNNKQRTIYNIMNNNNNRYNNNNKYQKIENKNQKIDKNNVKINNNNSLFRMSLQQLLQDVQNKINLNNISQYNNYYQHQQQQKQPQHHKYQKQHYKYQKQHKLQSQHRQQLQHKQQSKSLQQQQSQQTRRINRIMNLYQNQYNKINQYNQFNQQQQINYIKKSFKLGSYQSNINHINHKSNNINHKHNNQQNKYYQQQSSKYQKQSSLTKYQKQSSLTKYKELQQINNQLSKKSHLSNHINHNNNPQTHFFDINTYTLSQFYNQPIINNQQLSSNLNKQSSNIYPSHNITTITNQSSPNDKLSNIKSIPNQLQTIKQISTSYQQLNILTLKKANSSNLSDQNNNLNQQQEKLPTFSIPTNQQYKQINPQTISIQQKQNHLQPNSIDSKSKELNQLQNKSQPKQQILSTPPTKVSQQKSLQQKKQSQSIKNEQISQQSQLPPQVTQTISQQQQKPIQSQNIFQRNKDQPDKNIFHQPIKIINNASRPAFGQVSNIFNTNKNQNQVQNPTSNPFNQVHQAVFNATQGVFNPNQGAFNQGQGFTSFNPQQFKTFTNIQPQNQGQQHNEIFNNDIAQQLGQQFGQKFQSFNPSQFNNLQGMNNSGSNGSNMINSNNNNQQQRGVNIFNTNNNQSQSGVNVFNTNNNNQQQSGGMNIFNSNNNNNSQGGGNIFNANNNFNNANNNVNNQGMFQGVSNPLNIMSNYGSGIFNQSNGSQQGMNAGQNIPSNYMKTRK